MRRRKKVSYKKYRHVAALLLLFFIGSTVIRSFSLSMLSSITNDAQEYTTFQSSMEIEKKLRMKNERNKNKNSNHNDINSMSNKNNRSLLFVHVGKTGGETIQWRLKLSCELRSSRRMKEQCYQHFREQQQRQKEHSESFISSSTIGYMHCDKIRPKGSGKRVTTYMFSIRDPIDRIISWFQYMHPANCIPDRPSAACNLKKADSPWGREFYEQCFPNIDKLFQSIYQTTTLTNDTIIFSPSTASTTSISSEHSNETCRQLAVETLRGNGPVGPSNHMYFNYFHYANRTILRYPEREIVVIRQDHMWDDLRSIEKWLGGTNPDRSFENDGPVITHGSEKFFYRATLNEQSRLVYTPAICCIIQREISIYIQLLKHAKNLIMIDQQKTLSSTTTGSGTREDSIASILKKCHVLSLDELTSQCN